MKMWTDFVDKVFVVSLAERPERLQSATNELNKFGISFSTWVAIKNDDGKKGLIETMKCLFEHCLIKGYERVCIFEDDISILRPQFNELMGKCIEQLPKDFDLFYMGGNVWKQPIRRSENILQIISVYSTHAIIYSRKAIEYILLNLGEDKPYDTILVSSIQKLNKCYCSFPLLISQKDGFSDIKNKKVKYDKFIEKRYAEKTKGI